MVRRRPTRRRRPPLDRRLPCSAPATRGHRLGDPLPWAPPAQLALLQYQNSNTTTHQIPTATSPTCPTCWSLHPHMANPHTKNTTTRPPLISRLSTCTPLERCRRRELSMLQSGLSHTRPRKKERGNLPQTGMARPRELAGECDRDSISRQKLQLRQSQLLRQDPTTPQPQPQPPRLQTLPGGPRDLLRRRHQ